MIEIRITIDERRGISARAIVPISEGFTKYEQDIAERFKTLVDNCDPKLKNGYAVDYDKKPRDAQ